MLNENKNQKKRCDFGHPVFLVEISLFLNFIIFNHSFAFSPFVWRTTG